MKHLKVLGCLIAIFLALSQISNGFGLEVKRELPEKVEELEIFKVKIKISLDRDVESMILAEKIPENFEVIDGSGGEYKNGILRWLFIDLAGFKKPESQILEYKLMAPRSSGFFAFNGVLKLQNETFDILGDYVLMVGCVERWECSDWGQCKNGLQTRSCSDLNNCGTEFNKPETERTCNEGEGKETNKEKAEEGGNEKTDSENLQDNGGNNVSEEKGKSNEGIGIGERGSSEKNKGMDKDGEENIKKGQEKGINTFMILNITLAALIIFAAITLGFLILKMKKIEEKIPAWRGSIYKKFYEKQKVE